MLGNHQLFVGRDDVDGNAAVGSRYFCGVRGILGWIEHDTEVCCPYPDERLVMRIERTRVRRLRTTDLT